MLRNNLSRGPQVCEHEANKHKQTDAVTSFLSADRKCDDVIAHGIQAPERHMMSSTPMGTEHATELCPPNHPERHTSLHNLAYCLRDSSRRFEEMSDLIEAIGCLQEALKLRRPGHPLRDTSLNDLATCIQDLHHHTEIKEYLETSKGWS